MAKGGIVVREELLKRLMALDFTATDLQLYLNTHPDDTAAIKKYNSAVTEANDVRADFERRFGPLCGFRSVSRGAWNWIDAPWPWESEANFRL